MDETFHQKDACRIDFKEMDPSLAICFMCRNREEFDTLIAQLQKEILHIDGHPSLFEIIKEPLREWESAGQGEFSFPDASIVFSDCCNEGNAGGLENCFR